MLQVQAVVSGYVLLLLQLLECVQAHPGVWYSSVYTDKMGSCWLLHSTTNSETPQNTFKVYSIIIAISMDFEVLYLNFSIL